MYSATGRSVITTSDGSCTFFCPIFEQAFHSTTGAYQEAESKFVRPSGLLERPGPLRVLDICYGLGYNSAALLDELWRIRPETRVELIALEIDPEIARSAHALGWLDTWPRAQEVLGVLAHTLEIETDRLSARLLTGDARQTLKTVPRAWADGIFLDPFSPESCPALWTVEFLTLAAQSLKPTGTLVTYACGAAVRTALQAAGLQIGSTAPVGRRSPGTIAAWQGGLPALSRQEQEHLLTRAAIPYRDPTLRDDAPTLRLRREQEQAESQLELSSHWKKRWTRRRPESTG